MAVPRGPRHRGRRPGGGRCRLRPLPAPDRLAAHPQAGQPDPYPAPGAVPGWGGSRAAHRGGRDVGYANDRESKTGAAIVEAGESDPFDALLLLGDNGYPAGDPAALERTVFEPFQGVLDAGARLVAILGNHDVMQGHAEAQVAALGMPGR